MKTKKMFSKVLAAALAVLMLVGLMPVFASAAEGDIAVAATTADENLVMNKTATLEENGTYTINLEAYAKGEVTSQVIKQVVPTDVILILDQSGSMDNKISGIPADTYSVATPTNKQLVEGVYFHKVGDQYYRITATKEILSKTIAWVGDDGKTYSDDDVSYSWARKHDGQVYNTARPFATSTLSTWTRSYTLGFANYKNDETGKNSHADAKTSASGIRSSFQSYYTSAHEKTWLGGYDEDFTGYTVEFHNDGTPGGGWEKENPYYCAAVYVALTRGEVNTCRYVYTYVDNNGQTVKIGESEEEVEQTLDATACAISPVYVRDTKDGTRLQALQYAANKFINDIRISALANGVDHRVAVIGFASSETNFNGEAFENTELFVGAEQYQYNGTGNEAPSAHYTEALQSASTDDGYANLQSSVDNLAHYGATYPQYGFEMANGVFGANSATYTKNDGTQGTRGRIIIFMTDGEPGSGGSVNTAEANATITNANTAKTTYNAKVFSVAVQDSVGTDQAEFLNSVSSEGEHTKATSADQLTDFFDQVTSEITSGTTTVTLTKDAYMVDCISEYFVIPADFKIADNVTVMTAKHTGFDSFANPEVTTEYTAELAEDADGNVVGVAVKGFDYVTEKVWQEDNGSSVTPYGSKLVLEIRGVLAKDEAAVGTYINTNSDNSGIWDKYDDEGNYGMFKAFPMPTTLLDKKTFVLDYAKGAELNVYNATRFDSAADFLFSKVSESNNTYAGNYGSVAIVDGKVIYTPNTMKWDGYDTFYALGKDATKGDEITKNIWSKVNVLPANNVYYEDTFITNTAANIVGITYDGNWSEVKTGDNAEDANGGVHGWVEDLADDTGDSDGTNHSSTKLGATATFTFTGTGFDVYSRTNMYSGMVYAKITWKEINSEGVEVTRNKGLYVNTESVSGEYYNIPTLWFNGDYNTYTVTISVESAPVTNDGTTYSYCIDGIRIYNPIGDNIDDTVAGAYGDELAAYFESLRDFLLDAESLIDDSTTPDVDESTEIKGAVFIDKVENEVGVASNQIAVYEDYGPKNEVYLAEGQSIAFNVGEGVTSVQIGLKAPQASTNALVSFVDDTGNPAQGDITVGHTTDLFYTVTPDAKGNVIIKNNGEGLLSITKIKWLAIQETSFALTSTDALLLAADEFDTMPVVAYSLRASAPETEDSTDPETPVEPEQPTEPESPVEPETPTEPEEPTEPSGPNVEIENPEVPQQPDIEAVQEQIKQFVTSLFSAFRGWFGRQ